MAFAEIPVVVQLAHLLLGALAMQLGLCPGLVGLCLHDTNAEGMDSIS
jgi:hypothetical protein